MITILIIIIILLCIIEKIDKANSKNNVQKINNYNEVYKPKRYITTLNELKFYKVLMEIAKELNLIVFAQVSLYAILETRKIPDKKM